MKQSAGILLFKKVHESVLFFLVHPGGPFWKNKDVGAWSIPKGEYSDDEPALDAAKREFLEETGMAANGNFLRLEAIKMKSGKQIIAFALEGDADPDAVKSNDFEMEWPPRSGIMKRFPEIDRAGWFTAEQAILKLNPAQHSFIFQTLEMLK